MNCIEHNQYMPRLKAKQTLETLATDFLGCLKMYVGLEKGMSKNKRKMQSKAINIKTSPQETPWANFWENSMGKHH